MKFQDEKLTSINIDVFISFQNESTYRHSSHSYENYELSWPESFYEEFIYLNATAVHLNRELETAQPHSSSYWSML